MIINKQKKCYEMNTEKNINKNLYQNNITKYEDIVDLIVEDAFNTKKMYLNENEKTTVLQIISCLKGFPIIRVDDILSICKKAVLFTKII